MNALRGRHRGRAALLTLRALRRARGPHTRHLPHSSPATLQNSRLSRITAAPTTHRLPAVPPRRTLRTAPLSCCHGTCALPRAPAAPFLSTPGLDAPAYSAGTARRSLLFPLFLLSPLSWLILIDVARFALPPQPPRRHSRSRILLHSPPTPLAP